MQKKYLPAEWEKQSAILLAWPHEESDWNYILDEVQQCYREIITTIIKYQKVILIVPNEKIKRELKLLFNENVIFQILETNDTWTRDFGPITLKNEEKLHILDFKFNGWGLKFASDKDNLITQKIAYSNIFKENIEYCNRLNFVLEGGSIESDGQGTLLTTSECLLSPNRNGQWDKIEIEEFLKKEFNIQRILWVNHGYLSGDDTDSHIDTLARFCSPTSIAYVKCDDKNDEHYNELLKMEANILSFRTASGQPYNLIPLPMADTVIFDGERLPATYTNFLITNNAVLVPTYNSAKDKIAISQIEKAFPNHNVIGIDCSALIKQHGSLHCVTMQLPDGIL